jgi:hypothetical protein
MVGCALGLAKNKEETNNKNMMDREKKKNTWRSAEWCGK